MFNTKHKAAQKRGKNGRRKQTKNTIKLCRRRRRRRRRRHIVAAMNRSLNVDRDLFLRFMHAHIK